MALAGPAPGGHRQRCEVLTAAPVQRSPANQPAPRSTHVGVSLHRTPFHERGVPVAQELRAAALPLLAHDMHAPLVVFAGASPTRYGLEDFRRFTGTGVHDKMPDVDGAMGAGVGMLVLVVMVVGRCVEGIAGWRYSVLVHSSLLFLWAAPPGD
jgi:hypothetical protein